MASRGSLEEIAPYDVRVYIGGDACLAIGQQAVDERQILHQRLALGSVEEALGTAQAQLIRNDPAHCVAYEGATEARVVGQLVREP